MDKNIGIGILSTNRPHCLKRLIESIELNTKNLDQINFCISDDSNIAKDFYKIDDYISKKKWIQFQHIGERVGVARNSNFCLEMIKKNPYKFLLNNDVEILQSGWETIYFEAMEKTKIHAFCFRQLGLWGACKENEEGKNCLRPDKRTMINGVEIATIQEKPHGAILALDKLAFDTVGYFDEQFGQYGMEHHDLYWRISESKIQPQGIHDIGNSNQYFKIYNNDSTLSFDEKSKCYRQAQELFEIKKKNFKKEFYIGFKR